MIAANLFQFVILAKAGIQLRFPCAVPSHSWAPAFAGVTVLGWCHVAIDLQLAE